MSTEPYPEVSGEESGIVPSQSTRPPEWPKKIRTLTAAELDRLTIDSTGRFYWDGKLVNYETQRSKDGEPKTPESVDRQAMDIIDRAVYELGDRKPDAVEGAGLSKSAGGQRDAVDLDLVRLEAQVTGGDTPVAFVRPGDRVQLALSRWQAIGAVIVVVGVALGSIGLAAYGATAAHDWGCRTGMIKSYCTGSSGNPDMRTPRSDIPA